MTFTVEANGTFLSYQWQKSGSDLTGATSSTLNITDVSEEDEGLYRCVIQNIVNETVNSSEAELTLRKFVHALLVVFSIISPDLLITHCPLLLFLMCT